MDEDIDFVEIFNKQLILANWPRVISDSSGIHTEIEGSKFYFLEITSSQYVVSLCIYNESSGVYEFLSGLKVAFDKQLPYQDFIYLGNVRSRQLYGLHRSTLVRSILQTGSSGKHPETSVLSVSLVHKKLSFSQKTKVLKVPYIKYKEILQDIDSIVKTSNSYRDSIQRHLVNEAVKKYLGVEVGKTTNISKGEFAFLIKRLNLGTKKNTADYNRYLSTSDIQSLQELTMAMIDNEVFEIDYLRKLDDYFLKEKLEHIVRLGRRIIGLGSTNLKTEKAISVIKELYRDEAKIPKIGQMETLWQKYFEKYLLYIIFTYKQIYSKVELNLVGDKKYPDFLGVNHYNGVDVIEIKTHLKPALVRDSSHDNFAFSSDLSKAIIQTTNYIDAIKERAFANTSDETKLVQDTEQENLYRPRGIIIISSKERLVKSQSRYEAQKIERDFTKLRNSLGEIEIITFDEVLDIAENYAKKIANKRTE